MTANFEIPFTDHGAERFSRRVKRISYMRTLMDCGDIDHRGRIRVAARELSALVGEARSSGDHDAAKVFEKIKNLVVVCGRRGAVVTTYRDDGRHRDRREERRRRLRAEADRRRRVGR